MPSSSPRYSNLSRSALSCTHNSLSCLRWTYAQLGAVFEVATGKRPWAPSSVMGIYKEVQIHGELRLDRDVERMLVPRTLNQERRRLASALAKKIRVSVCFRRIFAANAYCSSGFTAGVSHLSSCAY